MILMNSMNRGSDFIAADKKSFPTRLSNNISNARSKAVQLKDTPPWLCQLFAVEAAYEYIVRNFDKAGALLESALKSKPHGAGPLSFDDVQSLALILKFTGDNAAESLTSVLIRARPHLEGAVDRDIKIRRLLFKALIAAMVPGVDIQAPVPGTTPLGVDDIRQSVDSANVRCES